jgi:hypothetical protein
MSADPYSLAGQWLYTLLSTDAQLQALVRGVWCERIPESEPWAVAGAAQRYVLIVTPPGGTDEYETGGRIVTTTLTYSVKVLARTEEPADLAAAVGHIHALLHGQAGPIGTTGYAVQCLRESPIHQLDEDEAGTVYLHRGGRYSVTVQEV